MEFLLDLVAQGASRDEILRAYPHLSAEDVEQALRRACADNRVVLTHDSDFGKLAVTTREPWSASST